MIALLPAFRRLALAGVLAAAALSAVAGRAEAQLVVVIVNGEPVTSYDVDQRSRLIELSTNKKPSRQEVIEELIDEKLKIQLMRRYTIPDIDKDVTNAFNNMARRVRATPKQFTESLAKAGVMPETLRSRIRADIIWSQVIRGRFQSSFQFSDKDILARLEAQKSDASPVVGYDYTLRPILFVVPRGSPPAAVEARRKEAEALRARFQDCEEGVRLVRGLRDVAVRRLVVRSSADLAPALREILDKTEIGRLTAPEVTPEGVEVFALCGKKLSSADDAPGKRKAREELFSEQFKAHATRYLRELRSQAMIEYR
jgi:peptidyl-prolyl cis-trans isomerase SurA